MIIDTCLSFSDHLLMTMQWLRIFWKSWNLEYIYFIWTLDILFMPRKLEIVRKIFVLKIDDHKLCPPSGKTQFRRQLIKQTSNAVCVSTDLGIVWKRRHQTHLHLIIAFHHLWIIFLHIHQNCRLTSLQIGLNPLMEFAD